MAATAVALVQRHTTELNEFLKLVQAESDPEEFIRYRKVVGKLMGEMLLEILTPICKEYPDLTPEALKPRT
jgi:hypothetical protein